MRSIVITAGTVTATGRLNDTRTADAIWDALPIKARGNTWGDEIYFSIPVHVGEEDGQEVVELGDLGFRPRRFLCFLDLDPQRCDFAARCTAQGDPTSVRATQRLNDV